MWPNFEVPVGPLLDSFIFFEEIVTWVHNLYTLNFSGTKQLCICYCEHTTSGSYEINSWVCDVPNWSGLYQFFGYRRQSKINAEDKGLTLVILILQKYFNKDPMFLPHLWPRTR
jgi:hypothetical protein